MTISITKDEYIRFDIEINGEHRIYTEGVNCNLFRYDCDQTGLPCLTDCILSIMDSNNVEDVNWHGVNIDDNDLTLYTLVIISQAVGE